MKKIQALLRILIFLGSLAYSAMFTFMGALFVGPTTLFSAPNSQEDRVFGFISLSIALVLFVLSFSIFRKKFMKPVVALFVVVTVSTLYRGFQIDLMYLYYPYVAAFVLLYAVTQKIEKD